MSEAGEGEKKKRRVLGEVQLEVDLSALNITRARGGSKSSTNITSKRLSDLYGDHRGLREQYNSVAQQLFLRDRQIDELKGKLDAKDATVHRLEVEKGKLLGEVKQAGLEKGQLQTLLDEELDLRKMIKIDTQKLFTDIKASYEQKLKKIKDEMGMKEEVISIKEGLIQELEKTVRKLRQEIVELQASMQKVRAEERETQGRMSESFRGSISMLQSELTKKANDLEKFEELREELMAQQRMAKKLHEQLQDEEKSLLEAHGDLKSIENEKEELETLLESKIEENKLLQKALEESNAVRVELETKWKDELHTREVSQTDTNQQIIELKATYEQQIANVKEEVHAKKELLISRDGQIGDLQNELKNLQTRITELSRELEKSRAHEIDMEKKMCESLNQLSAKSSESVHLQELKENLIAEKERVGNLVEKLAEAERNFGLAKVDVRVLNREKTTLENRIERKNDEIERLQKELQNSLNVREELDRKLLEIGKKAAESEADLAKANLQLEQTRRLLDETQEEKNKLEKTVKDLRDEIEKLKGKVTSGEDLQSQLREKVEECKRKEEEIRSKDSKIKALKTNLVVLKDASTVLDNQLREFESAFEMKLRELEKCENEKAQITAECLSLRESLQKTRIDLNETNSLKAYVERRLKDLESHVKRKEETSSEKVTTLINTIGDLASKNSDLQTKCNKLEADLESLASEKEYLRTRYDEASQNNYKLTQELHKCMEAVFQLKHEVMELTAELQETGQNAEERIRELKKLHATTLQSKDASNIQMQCTINQQAKLIQFLQDQNEALNKKKRFHLFSKEKDTQFTPTPKKGVTLPRTVQFSTPTPTPSRSKATSATPLSSSNNRFLPSSSANKASPLVLRKYSEDELLKELQEGEKNSKPEPRKDIVDEPLKGKDMEYNGTGVRKMLLAKEEKQNMNINCAFHIADDLYLFGCDQGLYSRKGAEETGISLVKIDGMQAVYQMEFISSLNSMLFIEGNEQRLFLASMGIVRTCAEAAECSQPRMKGTAVLEIVNCHMFQIRDVDRNNLTLCVTTQKYLHVLSWNESEFVLRQKVSTPEVVTSMLITPSSLIYGAGKVYELDTKNFELEEFLDETDASLYFVIFGGDDLTIPMAILDVGMSNWMPGLKPKKEYLICFPTIGVFVDEDGHRTRGEDITWSKFPQSITYRHPNLYIFHHSSVEVVRLAPDSYTTSRVGVDLKKENVGKEVATIPPSSYLQISTPSYLGRGARPGSIVVGSKDKHNIQVLDIDLESKQSVSATTGGFNKDDEASSSPSPSLSNFSISFGDSEFSSEV